MDRYVLRNMLALAADIITGGLVANDLEFLDSPRCRLFLEALNLENLDIYEALRRVQGSIQNLTRQETLK